MTTGRTRLCCLIGDPVEHSRSPAMFTAAFSELGEDCAYLAFRVKREDLKTTVDGLRAIGFLGCNVTMPHKTEIIKYLDELEGTAELVGSVNTILNNGGRLVGYNTDGKGVIGALEYCGVEISGKSVIIVGYGGAARGVAFELASTNKPSKILIAGRDPSKSKSLADLLRGGAYAEGLSLVDLSGIRKVDLIINATPLGMRPRIDESPVPDHLLDVGVIVMDLVYDPIETKLLRLAKAKGCKVIDGLEPLVHQGAIAFTLWTGRTAPLETMRRAVRGDTR
ncbi:MAG: shikimate dehydrogenase [Candidatus Methanomethyliales bacterium]|nr:shikimate dehydrogenase [Candidatus Methanomethylicales archaeon]